MAQNTIHIIGFGSQGSAWAQNLRDSNWDVRVYFHRPGESFQKARDQKFQTFPLSELSQNLKLLSTANEGTTTQWIAMLCPDSEINRIYDEYLAAIPTSLCLILAHGYAIYSGDLQLKSAQHQVALLAPKSIGPKLRENYQNFAPTHHSLVAGVSVPQTFSKHDTETFFRITEGLGFAHERLVSATFEQEAIGDLISEQGLLCGGIFNLLHWTMEAMKKAGIPEALIREECLTELELVAGMLRRKGPGQTFRSISQAAQCGTVMMKRQLDQSDFKNRFHSQIEKIKSKEFTKEFENSEWKKEADEIYKGLSKWEEILSLNKESL